MIPPSHAAAENLKRDPPEGSKTFGRVSLFKETDLRVL
jgi:hypothetical protein